MKQFLTAFAAALFAIIASISFSLQANAASYIDYKSLKSSAYSSSSRIQQVHYDRHSHHDEDYYDDDYYDEDDYRPRHHYKRKHHKRKYHKRHHYKRKRCYTKYVSKYVCEQPEPRCLRQRECIWSYGREYCRYVRKCSRTEKSCKYVKVPKRRCW